MATKYRITTVTEPGHSLSHTEELENDDQAIGQMHAQKRYAYSKYPESRGRGTVKVEEADSDRLVDSVKIPKSL